MCKTIAYKAVFAHKVEKALYYPAVVSIELFNLAEPCTQGISLAHPVFFITIVHKQTYTH